MIIYYDGNAKSWHSNHSGFTLGSNNQPLLPSFPFPLEFLPFKMMTKGNNIGPIVGILTSYNSKNKLIGNRPLFEKLQRELDAFGGIIVIFPPEQLSNMKVDGFTYISSQDKWLPITTPLPHVIYNRVPFRKTEEGYSFAAAIELIKSNSLPFFNPHFINKYELSQLLKQDKMLKNCLPDTELLHSEQTLTDFITKYGSIYVKPATGSKGKNIYRLSKKKNHTILLQSIQGEEHFSSLHEVVNDYLPIWMTKEHIIQEEINVDVFNGHRYDFRILATFLDGNYVVTGVGIRQSSLQDVTTHVPAGGKIIPYELVQNQEHDRFFQLAVEHCGALLTSRFGFFGEFSIDACIDKNGNYYIFEVNSKPMLFDEPEIETNRCRQLARLFYELSGF